jgi:son of sevenless-like protein
MNGYAGTTAPPGSMYVRALYNYDADDPTSLSFRQGDLIQVITQLESGWWDGFINGVRGWFPSNYCQLVNIEEGVEEEAGQQQSLDESDRSDDETYEESVASERSREPVDPARQQEEAAFWIPQATPDGRLYYFNTLTGVSTMELPLETPTSMNENGRGGADTLLPTTTRPPPEMLVGGMEREDDTDYDNSESESGSAVEQSIGSLPPRRHGLSRESSLESMNGAVKRERGLTDPSVSMLQSTMPPLGTTMTSFASSPIQGPIGVRQQIFEELDPVPLTWSRLIDDMRRAVERFRQAIENHQRSDFVRRAEDISDQLRLLLAAGSGTTDNHSGNPSIISTNKALYPHFRETMSRFSKLVLSSHIAAADFPPPDSYAKCLKEAEGVLNGVYGFVEVARQQRGEEIPRLIPGFLMNNYSGGNWRNNGFAKPNSISATQYQEADDYEGAEPSTRLDMMVLERLSGDRSMIEQALRRLKDQLASTDKIITPMRHKIIGDNVCRVASKVLEFYRPYLSTIESINLSSLGPDGTNPNVVDFNGQKQRLYDILSELLIACQAVASPLPDEWAELRNDSLEERLRMVAQVIGSLTSITRQIYQSLQLLSEIMPMDDPSPVKPVDQSTRIDSATSPPTFDPRARSGSRSTQMTLDGEDSRRPSTEGAITLNSKARQLAGIKDNQAVNFRQSDPVGEETPAYLRLEHEDEITYDGKINPPQLRGGTLTGLVEQLTRHDRLDSGFNGTFLLTYRSFTSAKELFEMLVKRWSIQPPESLSQDEYSTWVEKKQKPIQFRVVNILKSWLDTYWMEELNDDSRALIMQMLGFARDFVATTNTPGAAPLISTIEQRLKGVEAPVKRLVLTLNQSTPPPILPKNMKKLKFLDIDSTEFARQLTIIESRLYGKIKLVECLNKTWQKKLAPGEEDPAKNIKALILHSNQLTNWVAQMILNQNDVKRRVIVIKHFVSIADVSVAAR